MNNNTCQTKSKSFNRIALTLLMFVSIFSLSSCHKDDNTITPDVKQILIGKWKGTVAFLIEEPKEEDKDKIGLWFPDLQVLYNSFQVNWTFYEDGSYKIYILDELREEGKWEIKEGTQLFLSKFHDKIVNFTIKNNTLEIESERTKCSLTKVQ